MAAADSAHQAAVDALTKANRDVESAERDVAAARNALTMLPAPVAALDDEARDDLRQTLARLEEDRRQLPGRQRALHNARTTFARAYDPLRLAAPSGTSGNGDNGGNGVTSAHNGPREILDGLLARQEEALALAGEVQERLREAGEAAQAAPAVRLWTPARRPCALCGLCPPAWLQSANAFRSWTAGSTANRPPRRSKVCR